MNPAIAKLEEYLEELTTLTEFSSIEKKAEHVGLMNQIKSAIGQLGLCEEYKINSGSLVSLLPESQDAHDVFVAARMNESTNPENWEEVTFKGKQVWLSGGDLFVRK